MAKQDFQVAVNACVAYSGYTEKFKQNLGEYEISPEYEKYSKCYQSALLTYLAPHSVAPYLYHQFVAYSNALTEKVRAKDLTRKEANAEMQKAWANLMAEEYKAYTQQNTKMRNALQGLSNSLMQNNNEQSNSNNSSTTCTSAHGFLNCTTH